MKIVSEKGNRKNYSVLHADGTARHAKLPSHFVGLNLPPSSVHSVAHLKTVIVFRIQFIVCAGSILLCL